MAQPEQDSNTQNNGLPQPGAPDTSLVVSTLWIGDELSILEKLCLASFLHHGHEVVLYTYADVKGVPAGTVLKDAATILSRESIFRYGPRAGEGEGSYAGFSNLFRYKLLLEHGGWWVDTDVVCLHSHSTDDPYVFGWQDEDTINCAVMKSPSGSPFMQDLYETSLRMGQDVGWGDTGPALITALVKKHGLEGYARPERHFYPIRPIYAKFLFDADSRGLLFDNLMKSSLSVHFWNEMLRRGGIDKNAAFPPTCAYERLKALYGLTQPSVP